MTDPTKIDIDVDPTKQRMSGYTAHKNLYFDVPYITQVADNLYQGGCRQGLVLPSFLKHVISLYPWEQYKVEHDLDSYVVVRMYDSLNQATNQVELLAQWVNECRKSGPVLVHCQAGLNRSSLVVGRALILSGLEPRKAIETLRTQRSEACLCNQSFEDWLLK